MAEISPRTPLKKGNPLTNFVIKVLVIFLSIIFGSIYLLVHTVLTAIPLRAIFLLKALTQKKFILFVYSDSPIWKTYLENNILPKISEHAIILNWSERNQWHKQDWTVRAFRNWGGEQDFNPLAIVFCNFFKVKTVRFYRPFLDYKHGKEQPLHETESKLFDLVKRH